MLSLLYDSLVAPALQADSLQFEPPGKPSLHSSMLGKIEGRRRRGLQKMRWLDGITDSMDVSLGARASSAKTRGFHTQLDEGPETP